MSDLEQLLVVQGHDTRIRQLEYERESLPARAQIVDAQSRIAAVQQERQPFEAQKAELRKQQSLVEDEVLLIEQKVDRENARLYSGEVTGMKDLQAIQDEIASLGRHKEGLEDRVLEFMEQIEPLDAVIAETSEREEAANSDLAAATKELSAEEARLDAEIEAEANVRAVAAADVSDTLLATYAQIRDDLGGIGVARFSGKGCDGCHLSMSAVEIDRVKKAPAGDLVRCGSCERLLVR